MLSAENLRKMTEQVVMRSGVPRESPLFEPTVMTMLDEAMRAIEFGSGGDRKGGKPKLRRTVDDVIEEDFGVSADELTDIMTEVSTAHYTNYLREGDIPEKAYTNSLLTTALFMFRLGVQLERNRRNGGAVHRDDPEG